MTRSEMNLVTGATGIVGSHIVAALLAAGKKVRVLKRANATTIALDQLLAARNISASGLEYMVGDILDPLSLAEAMRGSEVIYHCAAMVSFRPFDKKALFLSNVTGTANVVNVALQNGVHRLCYISSTAAIGDEAIHGLLTEDSAWTTNKHRTGYSLSKRLAEMEVHRARQEGLNAVIVNPGIVIGAGNWGRSSTSIVLSCQHGMRIYPTGANGFVAAADVARFCLQAVENGWTDGRYLLVGENLPYKEVFAMACEAFGSPRPAVPLSRSLAMLAKNLFIRPLDFLGVNPFSLSSETIDSAFRQIKYANARARQTGFVFQPIAEAVKETVGIYLGQPELH